MSENGAPSPACAGDGAACRVPARAELSRVRDLELKPVAPLTVFVGPNGSGKSTVFDVCAFLSECFSGRASQGVGSPGTIPGTARAAGRKGRSKSNSSTARSPRRPSSPITWRSARTPKGRSVSREWLRWTRKGGSGRPFNFLDFSNGSGKVVSGEMPDAQDQRFEETLDSREMLAVSTLGQFAKHPRVTALRRFIAGWYLSYLSADNARGVPEAGPQERLSATGDNLANVVQYLKEQHPRRLERILSVLAARIPRLERVDADLMADGRLLLQIKDAPFDKPVLAKFASDGTLKMLAYLAVLYDPDSRCN